MIEILTRAIVAVIAAMLMLPTPAAPLAGTVACNWFAQYTSAERY